MAVLPTPPSTSPPPSVLVADDQPDVLEALRLLLKGEGFEVDTVASAAAVIAALERRDYDALLMDMNYARDTTSGAEGLDLLQRLKELEPDLPVAVMTAWGSVGGAVEAMRRGAQDYIEKPWDNARLLVTLRNLVELGRALRRTRRLDAENKLLRRDGRAAAADGREGPPPLIAESPKMRPVLELIERVGPSDANVLVTGEHGTGKELVAQWLHASSPRAARSLIPVNMGGLSEGVFESELFGHVKGAFTDAKTDRVGRFELADGGTIFLDEIANISISQQAKLLRVLQTGDVERVGSSRPRRIDVRVVSATNVDLRQEVESGRFREDLLFRLNTIEIHLPPLRERREDIPVLASHFLSIYAQRYRKRLNGFDTAAMQALMENPWQGNVRELNHVVERAVLLAQDNLIRLSDLALRTAREGPQRLEDMSLEDVEAFLIKKA